MESISSMNMIDGACSLAIMKSSLTIRDPRREGRGKGREGRGKGRGLQHFMQKIDHSH